MIATQGDLAVAVFVETGRVGLAHRRPGPGAVPVLTVRGPTPCSAGSERSIDRSHATAWSSRCVGGVARAGGAISYAAHPRSRHGAGWSPSRRPPAPGRGNGPRRTVRPRRAGARRRSTCPLPDVDGAHVPDGRERSSIGAGPQRSSTAPSATCSAGCRPATPRSQRDVDLAPEVGRRRWRPTAPAAYRRRHARSGSSKQVGREPVAAEVAALEGLAPATARTSAAATGRPRTAQHTSWTPWVHTSRRSSGVRRASVRSRGSSSRSSGSLPVAGAQLAVDAAEPTTAGAVRRVAQRSLAAVRDGRTGSAGRGVPVAAAGRPTDRRRRGRSPATVRGARPAASRAAAVRCRSSGLTRWAAPSEQRKSHPSTTSPPRSAAGRSSMPELLGAEHVAREQPLAARRPARRRPTTVPARVTQPSPGRT